ncbi:unnamed protein product [Nippostrongylus brasiliensis]|uniref:Metalloendopeptidase n=1 Tax=Nippostrongylus brasiliensis TaxID=27835 RepID=A0A158R0P4_NIPBR|nr:unnamed protein product [Nippostrongylus brasiliensis]
MWPAVLLLAVVVFPWASTAQLTFLTERDFRNGALLPISYRRMRPLYNDQRFPARTARSFMNLGLGYHPEWLSDPYRQLTGPIVPSSFQRAKRGDGVGVASSDEKWPGGRVPYVLSAAYTENQRAVIARAIAGYQEKTCIRFVPKTPRDRDYIVISKLDGCYADFARVGGRQQVSLADECIDYATICLGFIHEHQRGDRDSFVTILYQNVIPGANSDFDKLTTLDLTYYGETYDYFSIMHYEKNEGSKNGKNTIEAKVTCLWFGCPLHGHDGQKQRFLRLGPEKSESSLLVLGLHEPFDIFVGGRYLQVVAADAFPVFVHNFVVLMLL